MRIVWGILRGDKVGPIVIFGKRFNLETPLISGLIPISEILAWMPWE